MPIFLITSGIAFRASSLVKVTSVCIDPMNSDTFLAFIISFVFAFSPFSAIPQQNVYIGLLDKDYAIEQIKEESNPPDNRKHIG